MADNTHTQHMTLLVARYDVSRDICQIVAKFDSCPDTNFQRCKFTIK